MEFAIKQVISLRMVIKNLNYYRNLPWSYTLEEDKDTEGNKIYIVSVNELPGIKTDGYTPEEAFKDIKEAMDAAFELYIKMGNKIPEPKKINEKKYKGNITYRTSSEKHAKLAAEARRSKKPINKVIDEIITKALYAKK